MRQLMKCLITLWLTLSVSMGSYGFTGNDVKTWCDSEINDTGSAWCAGFISGLVEMDVFRERAMKQTPLFCIPEEATKAQLVDITAKYMKEHPEELHRSFMIVATTAIVEAFTCVE